MYCKFFLWVLSWSSQSGSNGLHTVASILLVCPPLSPFPALYFDITSAFLQASGFQVLVGSQISIPEMRLKSPLQNYWLYLLSKHKSCFRTDLRISLYMLTVHSLEKSTKFWHPTVMWENDCFLMSIITRFPLHIILLVVTEKDYFLIFP